MRLKTRLITLIITILLLAGLTGCDSLASRLPLRTPTAAWSYQVASI